MLPAGEIEVGKTNDGGGGMAGPDLRDFVDEYH